MILSKSASDINPLAPDLTVIVKAPPPVVLFDGVTDDKYATLHGSEYEVVLKLNKAPPVVVVVEPEDFFFWQSELAAPFSESKTLNAVEESVQ